MAKASQEKSLELTFDIPRNLFHFPAGLIYAVRYKSAWNSDWEPWTSREVKNMKKETHTLENLEYSWTKYEIQVRGNTVNFPSISVIAGPAPLGNGKRFGRSLLEPTDNGGTENLGNGAPLPSQNPPG